jgi:hypothetical protein
MFADRWLCGHMVDEAHEVQMMEFLACSGMNLNERSERLLSVEEFVG